MTFFSLDRRQLMLGVASATLIAAMPGSLGAQEDVSRGGVLRYATLGLDTADPHRHTGSIAVQQLYAEALTSIGPGRPRRAVPRRDLRGLRRRPRLHLHAA